MSGAYASNEPGCSSAGVEDDLVIADGEVNAVEAGMDAHDPTTPQRQATDHILMTKAVEAPSAQRSILKRALGIAFFIFGIAGDIDRRARD